MTRTRFAGPLSRGRLAARLAMLFVLVGCLVLVVASVRHTPINRSRPVVLMTGDWAPYVGGELPHGGPLAEMASLALRQQGLEPEIRYSSWTVAEKTAMRGEAMGYFPMVGSKARAKDFVWSSPLASFQYVLFYDRSRLADLPETAGDLQGLRVAHIAGYDYWSELEAEVDEFVEFPTSEAAFDALATGEVDLVPEGLLPGEAVVDSGSFGYDSTRFDHLATDVAAFASMESLYLMVPRESDYADLVPAFNKALADVAKTPEYADLASTLCEESSAEEVHLESFRGRGFTTLRSSTGALIGRTPRATRALVLQWPDPGQTDSLSTVEVKVLNGPFLGRVVSVDARDVVLAGQGSS